MNQDFLRGVLLKVAFKPEPLRQAQAALLYVALSGEEFTADVLPGEIVGSDTRLAGCATGALSNIGLIERVERTMSPAPSRNGAWVNKWRLAAGKRETVRAWLSRHGFDPQEIAEKQLELV